MTARIAVLGCGRWGRNHVRNFHQLGALAAVSDATEIGRATAAEIAPGVRVLSDVDAVFHDPSIDGVVLATPAPTHAPLALRALEAGKHVLCEKPLALSTADGLAVARAAEDAGRVLMVGHILEYHGAVRELARRVHEGEIGSLDYIYSHRLSLGTVRTEENVIWSFAPHDIALVLRLARSPARRVTATGRATLTEGVEDFGLVRLELENGCEAHVFLSWLHPFKEQRLVVVGSRGMAVFDDVKKSLQIHDKSAEIVDGVPRILGQKSEAREIEFPALEPLREECEDFLRAIETGSRPTADAQSALDVLAVLEAAETSLRAGGVPVETAIVRLQSQT